MRVLHVNDEPLTELGGVSRYLERLLPAQEALGVETRLIAGFVRHDGARRVLDFWDPAARRHVEETAAAFGADVVHLHSVLRECSVSVTATRGGAPVVMSVHDAKILGETDHGSRRVIGLVDRRLKSPWERWVARRHVQHFLPVSEELTARCAQAGLVPATWLPGPTQLPTAELTSPSSCHDVLYLGRLSSDKGVDRLLQAWHSLDADLRRSFRLRVVGDGPERQPLEQLARSLGVDAVFDGPLDEDGVSAAYAAARVVVLPYLRTHLRQASSLVALEAASHRRPAVVGDDPAVVEIVNRLGAGSAVDARRVDDLAAAVAAYLVDADRADREGAAAQATVMEHYAPEAVARGSIALYEKVLAGLSR
jgi:glycosyltransferase involved in cell wall biosynthesis